MVSSSPSSSSVVEVEPAIKELAQGYDLTVRLHCILLAQKYEARAATLDLVEKILQAFKSSLAVLKPHVGTGVARFEIKEAGGTGGSKSGKTTGVVVAVAESNGGGGTEEGGGAELSRKRKGINEKSYKTVTSTPHHDGYQWRKYGEKKIRGTIFPRCYYRCTYLHDQLCQAIKQIQQLNSDDPPLYEVTYNRNHTCLNKSRRNGEENLKERCIVFGESNEQEEDDDVTIVSSSSTNSKEDPSQSHSNPIRSKSTSLPPQKPSPLTHPPQKPVSDPSVFLRRLNQEPVLKRSRETVIAPTPLSVVGPAQFSISQVTGGASGLDPSLLRHLNVNEATKRLRTSLSFGNCNNNSENGNNNGGGKLVPPFTFLSSRFEKMMNQNNSNSSNSSSNNGSNIESLFTLPSERQLNSNNNSRFEKMMMSQNNNSNSNASNIENLERQLHASLNNSNSHQMERLSAARVRRSFSDNGNQMERSVIMNRGVERSLSQSQMEPNRNTPHHHVVINSNSNNGVRKETEGFFTLSSMESSITNRGKNESSDISPNCDRKNLDENKSDNKRVDNNGVFENKEKIEKNNTSERKENEKKEGLRADENPNSNLESSSENPKLNKEENEMESVLTLDTNMNLNNKMDINKNSLENQSEMSNMLRLSSLERTSTLNPKPKETSKSDSQNPNDLNNFLSLSSMKKTGSCSNLKSQNKKEMEGILSLSFSTGEDEIETEKRVVSVDINGDELDMNSPQKKSEIETEGILSLNSQNPNPNSSSHLEATVLDLQSKLNKSKEESTFTKQKVSDLESQISAIKATTEAWQRMMAEEASRRVAEAVSQLASSLASSSNSNSVGLMEGSRRTEILFPGVADEENGVEVPSLLSQLDNNNNNN